MQTAYPYHDHQMCPKVSEKHLHHRQLRTNVQEPAVKKWKNNLQLRK